MCKEYHAVLVRISPGYPPVAGWFHTRYSPVRRSPPIEASFNCDAPRLACVRPVASVHPEPGSNSSLYYFIFLVFYSIEDFFYHPPSCERVARDSPVLTLTFLLVSYYFVYHFFKVLFASLARGGPRSIGKAGAKIKGFYIPLQIFLRLFFIFFSHTLAPHCATTTYRENFFLPSKGKFCQRVTIGPKIPT